MSVSMFKFNWSCIVNRSIRINGIQYRAVMDSSSNMNVDTKINEFIKLGVKASTVVMLQNEGIHLPLPVQTKTLPLLLAGKKVIFESETGSGKTLAYLIPMIQDMGTHPCSNLIISPTRELATQVYQEVLKYVPDKSLVGKMVSAPGVDEFRQPTAILKNSKIMVMTPSKCMEILLSKPNLFSRVKRIVYDECDKLVPFPRNKKNLEKSLYCPKPGTELLAMMSRHAKYAQYIGCSASIHRQVVDTLQDMAWGRNSHVIRMNTDKSLVFGSIPQSISHHYCYIHDEGDIERCYVQSCMQLMKSMDVQQALVFVKHSSVEEVVTKFNDLGLPAVALYKEMMHPTQETYQRFYTAFEKAEIKIVVSLEETLRGLDFSFVKHAFVCYVPDKTENYLHVAGRVGRAGKSGVVTTLIPESTKIEDRKRLKRRGFVLGIRITKLELRDIPPKLDT